MNDPTEAVAEAPAETYPGRRARLLKLWNQFGRVQNEAAVKETRERELDRIFAVAMKLPLGQRLRYLANRLHVDPSQLAERTGLSVESIPRVHERALGAEPDWREQAG
jgi:hypothetical protein